MGYWSRTAMAEWKTTPFWTTPIDLQLCHPNCWSLLACDIHHFYTTTLQALSTTGSRIRDTEPSAADQNRGSGATGHCRLQICFVGGASNLEVTLLSRGCLRGVRILVS